jgi:hypothetical protein
MDTIEFLDKLRSMVIDYDKRCGEYPEHRYEGLAFFAYVLYTLGIEDTTANIINMHPEIYKSKFYD